MRKGMSQRRFARDWSLRGRRGRRGGLGRMGRHAPGGIEGGIEYLLQGVMTNRVLVLVGGLLVAGGVIGTLVYGASKTKGGRRAARKMRDMVRGGRHSMDHGLGGGAQETEALLMDALKADSVLGSRPIEVGPTDNGIVELWGWVANKEEKDRAILLAQGVEGVGTVISRIALRERPLAPEPGLADLDEEGVLAVSRVDGRKSMKRGASGRAGRYLDVERGIQDLEVRPE